MNRTLVRILTLVLCAVMLLGLIPALALAAETEETVEVNKVDLMTIDGQIRPVYSTYTKELNEPIFVEEEEPVFRFPAANAITNNTGSSTYYFETFQDLKDLAAQSNGQQINAVYEGTGDLVISEDLTLPENMDLLIFDGSKVVINKGITFTTNYISVRDFTVNGTWNSNRFSNVYGHLEVNGKANLNQGVLYLRSGGTISGLENVNKRYEEQVLYYWDVSTVSDIEDAIAAAKNTGDGLPHGINMYVGDTLTIDKSLTLPENMVECSIYGDGTIVIPKGITFTTYAAQMWLSCNTQVKGKFVNHGSIQFNSPATFDVTGTYSGKGKLQVYNQNGETELSQIVAGLDLDAFVVQEYENQRSHWWEILDPAYVTQLGTPNNLQWHKRLQWNNDGTGKLVDHIGGASWTAVKPVIPDGPTEFCITLYRNGEFYAQTWHGFGEWNLEQSKYACAIDDLTLFLEDLPSGKYHFTVQARTEVPGYCNSDIAASDVWEYTKPTERPKRPSTLSFSSMIAKWNKISGAERYQIQWFYSPTKSGDPQPMDWGWTTETPMEIWSWVITNNGPGYYYFKVRTLSENIEEKRHSAWSELSPAYYYSGNAKPSAPTVKSDIDPATGKPQVYWDRVPGCNKYRVYRSTSEDGTYKSVVLIDSGYYDMYGQYGYTDTNAKAGTKYYYKVRAYSYTDVTSSLSSAVSRMCDLARPTVSISGNSSTGKPVVKWETVEGAAKYYIYRATSKDGEYKHVKTAISARSYEDADAKAGTNYYYKVKAIHEKEGANSAYSAVVNRMCDLKRPVVDITHSTAGNPYLKWKEISGAEKYFIYRANSKSGSYTRIGSTTELKYVDKNVTEGKTYYYKVKAIHAKESANSAYSAIDSITAK